jgi:hypothetical protein
MAGATYRGSRKDTDSIYSRGSTILLGANLNPHYVKKVLERQAAEREKTVTENVERQGSPGERSED